MTIDVEALRAQTPGCAHRIHLNNAGAALLSQPTIDAMVQHLELEARIGGYEAADVASGDIDATSAALAELVGGHRDEIALFDNATHAWNAGFYSVPLEPGDRILTGRAEYGSNVIAYLQMAQRHGGEVVVIPNDEHGQLDVEALADAIDERTRLVGVSHIPTSGGLVNPAVEIGRVVRGSGALFLLDATQSVGQFPVDVDEIGCDLLSATGRKFLRGPRGTGFLWVRESVLDRLDPYVAEIASASWDGSRGFTWAPGARRFESWENSYVNVLGLGAAVSQALDIGLETIAERAIALGEMLRAGLDEIPGVSTHDLGVTRCAIVTAKVNGLTADEVRSELAQADINVTTTVATHTPFDTEDRGVHPLVRLSPHYYNTEDEIGRALDVVRAIARNHEAPRARYKVCSSMLTLYEHPFALYCQKVLVALNELGVAYDVLEEQRDFDRAQLAELWPPASIPVLRDGDRIIGETSIIIEHVAGPRLVPSLEARLWDRICDQYVSDAVQAIVADTFEEASNERAVAQARGRLEMAYGMLEPQLEANEFLAGEEFTIADCAAAPGLFFALAIHPWDEGTHPQLTRYYRALAKRPSFAKVIADARRYRQLFPLPWPDDFDRYH